LVFDRNPPLDAPRPKGVVLVGGPTCRDEVLAAFRRCSYFFENNIPVTCVDSVSRQPDGFYRVELDYFLELARDRTIG